MEIDLGAIVKGYFADQLQQYFLAHGVSSAIIDLGGNVLTIGRQPETLEKWHVGVRNPFHKDTTRYIKRRASISCHIRYLRTLLHTGKSIISSYWIQQQVIL